MTAFHYLRRHNKKLEETASFEWEVRSQGFAGGVRTYASGYAMTEKDAATEAKSMAMRLDSDETIPYPLGIVWFVKPRGALISPQMEILNPQDFSPVAVGEWNRRFGIKGVSA